MSLARGGGRYGTSRDERCMKTGGDSRWSGQEWQKSFKNGLRVPDKLIY